MDNPQELLNCRVVTPFGAQTQLKLHGSYPLPADVVVSAVYQNMSGPEITASYSAPLADIQPSLGRPLSGAARIATVPLITPGTTYEGRATRLDVRFTKRQQITSRVRAEGYVDVYNILNSNSILTGTNVYGPRWLLPTTLVEGRLMQFGASVTF